MSDAPPVIGEENWGDDLNAYLASLEERIAILELKPEYIYNSYAWQFSSSAPPATGSQLRLNNADPTLATLIDMRKIDSDGADRTPVFQQLTTGSTVRINDWDNAANLHRYSVSGTPTMDATNVQIPVTWQSGAGVIPNAKINVAFLITLVV